MKWSSQKHPVTRFVGNVAISSIFDGFVACLAAPWCCGCQKPPMTRFVGNVAISSIFDGFPLVPHCGSLWRPIQCPYRRVWRHRGLRLRCSDATSAVWLARLAGWLGWLAGLAGWVQLAGCCWLAAAMKVVPHARCSRRSADSD